MMTVSKYRTMRSGIGMSFAVAMLTTISAAPAGGESKIVNVALDQAKLVSLPERIATLVIGNPLIVDAALQPGGNMVLTGKSYGTTNVIALDRGGKVLMQKTISVGAAENTVVVYRGVARETYSCAPQCQIQIAPGDAEAVFNLAIAQSNTRSTQAQTAARQ